MCQFLSIFLFYQNVTYPKIIFRFYLFVIGHLSQAIILANPFTWCIYTITIWRAFIHSHLTIWFKIVITWPSILNIISIHIDKVVAIVMNIKNPIVNDFFTILVVWVTWPTSLNFRYWCWCRFLLFWCFRFIGRF